ncbi:MAG: aldo/keto reductase, partial [Proteobacteria bacterium]|nr:aldo/keto reductase [Pseudomonadota bacterium]
EGKIRYYGVALGPDNGWQEEGEAAMRERQVHSLEITYNILEQEPALRLFPVAAEQEVGVLAREPHASQVLTGKLAVGTAASGGTAGLGPRERSFVTSLSHAGELHFLAEDTGRTIAQSAIKFCLTQPLVASALPNITNLEDLAEYAAAPDTAELYPEEQERLLELWEELFCPEEYREREEEC